VKTIESAIPKLSYTTDNRYNWHQHGEYNTILLSGNNIFIN